MTKPVLTTFEQLAPILIQEYERYLPTAFNDSMTMLQKVNKIIKYLQETGKLVGKVVEQWNEVMKWVMNEGLTDSINKRLNEMLLDGTFNELINVTILGSKATIIVSETEPINAGDTTLWYQDKGDTPIVLDPDESQANNIVVADDEPTTTKEGQVWYDIE